MNMTVGFRPQVAPQRNYGINKVQKKQANFGVRKPFPLDDAFTALTRVRFSDNVTDEGVLRVINHVLGENEEDLFSTRVQVNAFSMYPVYHDALCRDLGVSEDLTERLEEIKESNSISILGNTCKQVLEQLRNKHGNTVKIGQVTDEHRDIAAKYEDYLN